MNFKGEKNKTTKTYFRKRRKKKSWFYSAEDKKQGNMFKTVWSGRGRVEMNISATFSSFYSKKKKMWLRFLILVAPSYSDPFISFVTDGKGVPCLGLALSLHFYHWGWKGTGELLLNDMCHPLCFFFCFFQLNSPLPSSPSHSLWQSCISPFCAFRCFSLKLPEVWNF